MIAKVKPRTLFSEQPTASVMSERKKAPFKDWQDLITRVQGVGPGSAAKFSAEGLTVNGSAYQPAPGLPAAAKR